MCGADAAAIQTPRFPRLREAYELCQKGQAAAVTKLATELVPITSLWLKWAGGYANSTADFARATKAWLGHLGLAAGPVRPPAVPMSDSQQALLRADLEQVFGSLPAPAREN
jgi:dihydrodipicolinate synthase/N-acetylneuraminate lyase